MGNKIAVFDGQVFQSAAWDRGMGKYSLNLLEAISSHNKYGYEQTYIIFTKRMHLKDEAKEAIQKAAPYAEFVFLDLNVPDIHDHRTIEPIMKRNKAVLDEFVFEIEDKHDIDFVILSLFIDQVCSVFPDAVRKILLFYDLIPLQYNERYGAFHNYDNYLRRFKVILESDVIWTISQTVADDLMLYMGIDQRKLVNINGAPIQREQQKPVKPRHVQIKKKFLLMPSGNDLRKNNDRAVDAVKIYNEFHEDEKISLVITSFFDDGTRNRLLSKSDDLIFTGNVSEAELRWLYENAEAVLFVPEYEGLGLPILEGIEVNKPVVCSNLTVFNEMSETAFYYADQFSPLSICRAIEHAINGDDFSKKKKEYNSILKKYTWSASATDALNSLERHVSQSQIKEKLRIAIFTPDPSSYSAIGKFNMYLHPALTDYFEIDYYVERGVTGRSSVRPSYLGAVANVYEARTFNAKKYKQYDAVIYHLGNSEFHLETIKNALYLPGIAIAHDVYLKGIFEGELLSRKYITESRLDTEEKLNTLVDAKRTSHMVSLASAQRGLIAHSEYSKSALAEVATTSTPINKACLPVATPKLKKNRLDSRVSIGFAGIIHPAKGLNILDSIQDSGLFDNVDIFIFGIPLIPESELQRINTMHNVTILTNLTDFQFQSKLAEIDILVNYRPHYNGEASASTLEAMRFGVVPIVRRVGWYDELPDDAVVKVNSQAEIIPALYGLCKEKSKRENMSKKSRELTASKFTFSDYAQNLYNFVKDTQASGNINNRVAIAFKEGATRSRVAEMIRNPNEL